MVFVGNDIVDLCCAETRHRETDARFLKRALHPVELAGMPRATDPQIYLWSLWAAKETAYKIGKKMNPQLVFSPPKFVVEIGPLLKRKGERQLNSRVSWPGGSAWVRWEYGPDWIHCTGVSARQPESFQHTLPLLEKLSAVPWDNFQSQRKMFSPEEWASIHSLASVRVRQLAKHALAKRGYQDVEIIRSPTQRRPGPPVFYQRGIPLPNLDLSFSHHGRYVAATLYFSREDKNGALH